MVGGFPVHNWCPYCGRPLAQGTLFCPYCGYQLGTYLGVAVTPAPPPMWSADPLATPPYRLGRFPRPTQVLNQPAMNGMVSAPSAWDGRVHSLVDAYGRRWDGHQWVPNPQEDWKHAVADTPKPVKKHPPFIVQLILFLGLFGGIFLVLMFFFNPGKNPPPNGNNNPGGNGGSTATWYMHYNCGGDAYCMANMIGGSGLNTGIVTPHNSQAECESALILEQRMGLAQSYWCSASSNPADTGP
jgi:hypothetical protein